MEYWKDVVDYEENYQISNLGIIKNKITGKCLSYFKRNGYYYVSLWKNGKQRKYRVHRLVAKTFIPNPYNYEVVNHIDENKLNNNVDNLEWCSQKDNLYKWRINHNIKPTKKKKPTKEKKEKKINNYHLPISINQYSLDNQFLKKWNSMMEIERTLNIKSGNICNCCKNIRKTAGGFIWKYGGGE